MPESFDRRSREQWRQLLSKLQGAYSRTNEREQAASGADKSAPLSMYYLYLLSHITVVFTSAPRRFAALQYMQHYVAKSGPLVEVRSTLKDATVDEFELLLEQNVKVVDGVDAAGDVELDNFDAAEFTMVTSEWSNELRRMKAAIRGQIKTLNNAAFFSASSCERRQKMRTAKDLLKREKVLRSHYFQLLEKNVTCAVQTMYSFETLAEPVSNGMGVSVLHPNFKPNDSSTWPSPPK